jgi:murein DD-endopeptidase MepM/ murein hydrolase activator NlpD
MSPRVGQLAIVTTPAGLNARTSPGGSIIKRDGRNVVRPKGFKFRVSEIRAAEGRRWAKADVAWYAIEHLGTYTKPRAIARVASPVPGYRMSTPWRKRPNNNSYWQARGYHTGADFAAPTGARVVAVRNGVVRHLNDAVLGNVQLLYADNGQTYWYCHLSRRIGSGQRVKKGQTIGKVGDTGSGANGPHLHLERRSGHGTSWSGTDRDPMEW